MRFLVGLMALFLISCAHDIDRQIASSSDPIVLGMVDLKYTTIRHFLPENSDHKDTHLFYISPRDWNNQPVDLDHSEFSVSIKRKVVVYSVERVARGRYLLSFNSKSLANTVIKLQGKSLKLLLENNKQRPDRKNSSAQIISNDRHTLVVNITLKDKNDSPVSLLDLPEVITNEDVVIKDIKMVKTGLWQVSISYPEENFILYISLRANGIYLNNLLRYQHIEK